MPPQICASDPWYQPCICGSWLTGRTFSHVNSQLLRARPTEGLSALPLRQCSQPRKQATECILQVWKLRTGQCLRRYERAHAQGVTSACFSRDSSHVLSSSYDGLARVHGIKSGKLLKEFRGHTSYVNYAIYSPDGSQVSSVALYTPSLLQKLVCALTAVDMNLEWLPAGHHSFQ